MQPPHSPDSNPGGVRLPKSSKNAAVELLTEEERQKIIDRAHSAFAWVGNLIPEKIRFDDVDVELRNIVFDLRTKKKLTDEDREHATLLIERIKERRDELEDRLKRDRLTREAAVGLLEEISGLVKAINDLRDVELSDDFLERKAYVMDRVEDEKRWKRYLDQIKLG